jgi:hypothetical protein
MATKKKAAMPKWQPAPQEWIDAFDAALPKNVERRKMFGYPAAFERQHGGGSPSRRSGSQARRKDRDTLMKAGGKTVRGHGPHDGSIRRRAVSFRDKPAEEVARLIDRVCGEPAPKGEEEVEMRIGKPAKILFFSLR